MALARAVDEADVHEETEDSTWSPMASTGSS